MQKLLLVLLAFFSSAALADGVDNMVAQCEEVMRCELCRVTNGPVAPGTRQAISYTDASGVVRVEFVDAGRYGWFQEPGYGKDPQTGHFIMCDRVRIAMRDPSSVEAKLPRIMFRQDWDGKGYCPPFKR